jgi:hypothetical protein
MQIDDPLDSTAKVRLQRAERIARLVFRQAIVSFGRLQLFGQIEGAQSGGTTGQELSASFRLQTLSLQFVQYGFCFHQITT